MKFKNELVCIVSLGIMVFALACEPDTTEKRQVAVTSKQGESCLVDQKCKVTVRRYESAAAFEQGNVYYRCLVSKDFYDSVGIEEKVVIDIKTCEKVNP